MSIMCPTTVAVSRDFGYSVISGRVPNVSVIHKFGRNPDIDSGGGFEAIWNGGGDYTGFNSTAAETIEVFSSDVNDAGTLLSSGISTAGGSTTLVDTGATFVSDGVATGDILINDTKIDHAIVTSVTETIITVLRMEDGSDNEEGDSYRVATQASTGAAVIELHHLLDANFDSQPDEYIILNGTTGVESIGTYIRNTRAHCHGGVNVGAITGRQSTTTANVTFVMPIGYGSTMITAYTVPRGKRGYIVTVYAGIAGKVNANCNIRLMSRLVNDDFRVLEEFTIRGDGSSYVQRTYPIPKDGEFNEMTDIKIMADSDTNNTAVAAGFDILLENM